MEWIADEAEKGAARDSAKETLADIMNAIQGPVNEFRRKVEAIHAYASQIDAIEAVFGLALDDPALLGCEASGCYRRQPPLSRQARGRPARSPRAP